MFISDDLNETYSLRLGAHIDLDCLINPPTLMELTRSPEWLLRRDLKIRTFKRHSIEHAMIDLPRSKLHR